MLFFTDNDIPTLHHATKKKALSRLQHSILSSPFFLSSYFCLKRGNARVRTLRKSYRALAERKRSGNWRSCAFGVHAISCKRSCTTVYVMAAREYTNSSFTNARKDGPCIFQQRARAHADRNFSRCPTDGSSFFLSFSLSCVLATYGAYSIREGKERKRRM